MANSEAGTSNGATRTLRGEHQVFLNFRGPDTRKSFTDFLYDHLNEAGVRVFRDSEKLHVGEVIGENLLNAIDNSIIYIPIFSSTYASSKWCLRELTHIMNNVNKSDDKERVLPIFFLVIPDDVKLKTARYSKAFRKHEEEYPNEVKAWKEALRSVSKIKGFNVGKEVSQAETVKSVVLRVLEKLKVKEKSVSEHLIGLDHQVKVLKDLIEVNEPKVRLIGIYGMGGLGKTTIAKVVFNELCSPFGRYCSFVDNVRERSTMEGIAQLQKKLLYDIVGSSFLEKFEDSDQGMTTIAQVLHNKKVLVVLDDVDDKEHIKKLTGNLMLHSGSRIIITTRDKAILQVEGSEDKLREFEMQKMDDALALQLFCGHVFGKDFPSDDYHRLSSDIISLMEGLPLAIELVGSMLKGKGKKIWKETLSSLRQKPKENIVEKLKISYDDLENDYKQIFLDIACFLFNEKKTDATYIWKQHQFSPQRGIEVLTEKCLIKIMDNDHFWMHNQLIELGRFIVREDSKFNLEDQSRLWVANEALKIIKTKKMKDMVQAIKMDELNDSIKITKEEFENLRNLRLLKLGNGTYAADFAKYCSKLGWISCRSPTWDLTGHNMNLNNLVVFKLHDTGFADDAKSWDLIKSARNLKVLYLTQCHGITTTPDFSNCLGLKKLTLAHCDRLKRIASFVGDLKSLNEIEIECCKGLTDLPEEVGALEKLKRFSLRGCSGLRGLPCSFRNLTSLIELDLSKTGIAKLPTSVKGLLKLESFLLMDTTMKEFPKFIEKLKSLRVLSLPKNGSYSPEHQVWQLPSGISMLEILKELEFSGHDEMNGETPVGVGDLSSFRTLNLTSTQICDIPRNIDMLHHLQTLNLTNCNEIQGLSKLTTRTTNMLHQQTSSPPELASLSRLDLKTLVQPLPTLLRFDLLCPSFRWKELLPPSLILRNLTTLEFYYVQVEDIPFDRLPELEILTIDGCELLQGLTIISENLRQAHLSFCPDLLEISFPFSEKLESFYVFGCGSLETIKWSDCTKKLEKLEIKQCNELTEVWGLEHLKSLRSLEVTQCPSLRKLIDASCTNIPDDCLVTIQGCGDFIKDSTPSDPPGTGMPLMRYVQESLPLDTSNFKSESDETEGREKATASTTSRESGDQMCIAVLKLDLHDNKDEKKAFKIVSGFRGVDSSDLKDQKLTVTGFIDPVELMRKLRQTFHTDIISVRPATVFLKTDNNQKDYQYKKKHDDWNEQPIIETGDGEKATASTTSKESCDQECHGGDQSTSSINDSQSKPGNTASFEAMGIRREMRNGMIGGLESTDVGNTASMETSCQKCEGVKHYERSCQVTTEVEDQRDLPSMKDPFTIGFIFKIKLLGGVFSVTLRRTKNFIPNSVAYDGLIADVKRFGFISERMWYKTPDEDRELLIEIKSDEHVKEMLQLASKRGFLLLIVEGGINISSEEALIRARQWGCTVHIFVFFFCVAFFLFLSLLWGKLDFASKSST